MMKPLFRAITLASVALSLAILPPLSEAKRLGGGRPAGMQRTVPDRPANAGNQAVPAQQPAKPANAAAQQPAQQPAAAPATPGKRSWLGPIAGLAAGLGIAALASHFGFGEGLGNMMTMLLLGMVALFAVRWFMSRRNAPAPAGRLGEPAFAGAGAGLGSAAPVGGWGAPAQPANGNLTPLPTAREALPSAGGNLLNGPAATAGAAGTAGALAPAAASALPTASTVLPGGIPHDEFIRLAKMVFIRMQAANDAGNIDDLRKFTTPELFASLRLDIQDRKGATQQTDVVTLDAEVADVAQEGGQDVVSVRYTGLIREEAGAAATPFAELWHLVRPTAGGDWAIAGITPLQG